jgi:hypothetical protein
MVECLHCHMKVADLFICGVHKDGDRLQWQVEPCQFKSSPLASVVDCTGFKSLHICGLCALYCSSALWPVCTVLQ